MKGRTEATDRATDTTGQAVEATNLQKPATQSSIRPPGQRRAE